MFIGGALLFATFLVNEWFHPLPFFKLQLLSRRNFTHGLMTLWARSFCWLAWLQYPANISPYSRLQAAADCALVFARGNPAIDRASSDGCRPEPAAGRPPVGHGDWTCAS
jgi:hypothetical protein